jgi:hypothetical protein
MAKFRIKMQYVMDVEAPTQAQAVIDAAEWLPPESINVTAECYIPKPQPAERVNKIEQPETAAA